MFVLTLTNAPSRFHGYAASVLTEIGTNVFFTPKLSVKVRSEVPSTIANWEELLRDSDGAVTALWASKDSPSGFEYRSWGVSVLSSLSIRGSG